MDMTASTGHELFLGCPSVRRMEISIPNFCDFQTFESQNCLRPDPTTIRSYLYKLNGTRSATTGTASERWRVSHAIGAIRRCGERECV